MHFDNDNIVTVIVLILFVLGFGTFLVYAHKEIAKSNKAIEGIDGVEMFVDEYQRYGQAYNVAMNNLVPTEFDVYLINLDRNKDRLEKFTRFYSKTDLQNVKSFKRVTAVDGRTLDVRKFVSAQAWKELQDVSWYGYRTRHNQLTPGAVGCYLSHLKVYKMIRNAPHEYGIVFEDDVKFVKPDVYRQIRHTLSIVPSTWDILLLGCVCHVCNKHETYQDLKHFFLMHAYVIKKSSAIKILNYLEHQPIRQQIDSELSTLASGGKLQILCVNRWIVAQDNMTNVTTIQTPLKVLKGVNPFDIPQV